MLVVVVDFVVLEGSVAVVVLVVVMVDLVSEPGAELVVVVVDSVTPGLGVVLVVVELDLVTSSAVLKASSIIVAISMATNIFFISKPQRKKPELNKSQFCPGHQYGPPQFQVYRR